MTRITLPFEPGKLAHTFPELEFAEYHPGGPVDHLSETEFWVPPYSFNLDFTALFEKMPELSVIQTQSAGVDNIIEYVDSSVALCSARGVHDAATSELGMALILAAQRKIPDFVRAQDRGDWAQDFTAPSLADRHVMIVGYGSIGKALERRLEGFEVDITRVARTARDNIHAFTELPELIGDADIIVVLAPYNQETHHLVDAEFLSRMKENALLVNLARGRLVDTEALVAAASQGRIRAALDVTNPEPLPNDHPLWSQPNVLITPHVGGGTTAMKPRMQSLLVEQLARFSRGEDLLNTVAH